ncbi:MAG TPA: 16S rRNA (guanine(966)-N(2))-methyltransferase RsmD [candidate division Zixibacteria bacterium]|nr:16S rRNA (guanine(966)-N(2))-methyltransferase RsmD [candidate division Zixibacteria bacterium]
MRIAGGEYKGRVLKVPKSSKIRPSTEKTREAIFSVLGGDILDAKVADLFCGSGALGLEALSRGAESALFVDLQPSSISIVKENIRALGLELRASVMVKNAFSLRAANLDGIGIIFADPPYNMGYAERLVSLLSLQKSFWHGILILEHEPKWSYDGEKFELAKRLEFGDSAVSFLLGPRESDERTASDD